MTDWFPIGVTEPPHSLGVYCHQRKITTLLIFILKNILYIYFQRGRREGETEGEKHPCVVASHVLPTGDLAHNPGMCHDWELNQLPFGLQATTQSAESYQPGIKLLFKTCFSYGFQKHPVKKEILLTLFHRASHRVTVSVRNFVTNSVGIII